MYGFHPSMLSGGSIFRAQGVARRVLLPSAGWCCYQNEFFMSGADTTYCHVSSKNKLVYKREKFEMWLKDRIRA